MSIHKYLIIGCLFWISCRQNENCKVYYIGEFRIDTSLITTIQAKKYVIMNRWDTVLLISDEKGSYSFLTEDRALKECEGSWHVKSTDMEGNCFGYIKQNNRSQSTIRIAFDIWISISGDAYFLPFRKIRANDSL